MRNLRSFQLAVVIVVFTATTANARPRYQKALHGVLKAGHGIRDNILKAYSCRTCHKARFSSNKKFAASFAKKLRGRNVRDQDQIVAAIKAAIAKHGIPKPAPHAIPTRPEPLTAQTEVPH